MLLPIKQNEINKLIPSVATGNQFNSALGNPQKIFQRIMISAIGGVITLLISQSQITSQFYSLWLVLGVVFLLYILWGPILEASRKNSKFKRYSFSRFSRERLFCNFERISFFKEISGNIFKIFTIVQCP